MRSRNFAEVQELRVKSRNFAEVQASLRSKSFSEVQRSREVHGFAEVQEPQKRCRWLLPYGRAPRPTDSDARVPAACLAEARSRDLIEALGPQRSSLDLFEAPWTSSKPLDLCDVPGPHRSPWTSAMCLDLIEAPWTSAMSLDLIEAPWTSRSAWTSSKPPDLPRGRDSAASRKRPGFGRVPNAARGSAASQPKPQVCISGLRHHVRP